MSQIKIRIARRTAALAQWRHLGAVWRTASLSVL